MQEKKTPTIDCWTLQGSWWAWLGHRTSTRGGVRCFSRGRYWSILSCGGPYWGQRKDAISDFCSWLWRIFLLWFLFIRFIKWIWRTGRAGFYLLFCTILKFLSYLLPSFFILPDLSLKRVCFWWVFRWSDVFIGIWMIWQCFFQTSPTWRGFRAGVRRYWAKLLAQIWTTILAVWGSPGEVVFADQWSGISHEFVRARQ